MRKGIALILAAGLLVFSAPAAIAKPPKKATVVEGVGVAGVNLGMTDKQAVGKWGKPNGGKCSSSKGSKIGNCSWTVDNKQVVNVLTVSHKIVNIGMLGTLWGTKKAKPGKTTFEQLAKLYKGIKIGYTCALDFGHVAILKKGKVVTVFATSNNTPPTAKFGQINIVDLSKTGYAQIDKGAGLTIRSECDPKNRQTSGPPTSGGENPGATTPAKPRYFVSGTTGGAGDGEVSSASTAAGAECSRSSCTVGSGSQVTLTATALSGSHFVGWDGDCTGTGATFTFASVDADKTCRALFDLDPE